MLCLGRIDGPGCVCGHGLICSETPALWRGYAVLHTITFTLVPHWLSQALYNERLGQTPGSYFEYVNFILL